MTRLALIQHAIVWENQTANFNSLAQPLQHASAAGAEVVVLPEMFACGFSMRASALAEREDGPTLTFMREQARAHNFAVVGSLPLLHHERPTNTLAFVTPHGETTLYRKRHPFSLAGEHLHYDAGNDLVHVTYAGLRFALFVCYDLRFADDFWRVAPQTDVYLVVANWPEARREHWQTLLRARAIENLAYVAGVNRVGQGDAITYRGDSALYCPLGTPLVQACDQPTVLIADVSAQHVAATRERLPFLADRRG